MKEALQYIWMAETRNDTYHALSTFQKRFEAKYPKATDCLVKDVRFINGVKEMEGHQQATV